MLFAVNVYEEPQDRFDSFIADHPGGEFVLLDIVPDMPRDAAYVYGNNWCLNTSVLPNFDLEFIRAYLQDCGTEFVENKNQQ